MERDVEKVATVVVDAAFHIYKDLGPGLLESVYEVVLEQSLEKRGLYVERQKAVSFEYEGIHFENKLFLDMLVNNLLVVELKSVEKFSPHSLETTPDLFAPEPKIARVAHQFQCSNVQRGL